MNNVNKLQYWYSQASLRLSLYRGKLIGSRIINFWDMILTFRGAIIFNIDTWYGELWGKTKVQAV